MIIIIFFILIVLVRQEYYFNSFFIYDDLQGKIKKYDFTFQSRKFMKKVKYASFAF